VEVSPDSEGLNVKQLQMPNGSAIWQKPPASATGKRKENKRWTILKSKEKKCMQTIDVILSARNLTEASREVIRNKGAAGVDDMSVKELKPYLDKNRDELTELIRQGEYYPQPIRGKEIPKSNKKKRLLGIPTVVDRMLQQAVVRIIMPQYEYMFSVYSYGFRPGRNTHQAIQKSLDYINSGYQHIVDIDLIPI
jgi:RNA-directed DNA polymerase